MQVEIEYHINPDCPMNWLLYCQSCEVNQAEYGMSPNCVISYICNPCRLQIESKMNGATIPDSSFAICEYCIDSVTCPSNRIHNIDSSPENSLDGFEAIIPIIPI